MTVFWPANQMNVQYNVRCILWLFIVNDKFDFDIFAVTQCHEVDQSERNSKKYDSSLLFP